MGLGKLAATATAYKLASAAAAHNSGSGSDSLSSSTASLSRSPDRERLPLLPPSEPFASGSASNYQSRVNHPAGHGMTASTGSVGGYGAASTGMGTVRASSPETVKRPSAGIDEIDVEELLEDHGLFVGSYRRLIALYTLVPLSLLALLAILAPLPLILHTPHPPLPSPYSDALIGISLWALARALTPPLTSLIELVPLPPYLTLPLTALSHALLRNTLRILGFAALAIGPSSSFHTNSGATVADPSFARIWAFALGCAAADAVAGSAQGYAQLALYEAAMVSPAEARALVGAWLRGRKARAAYHSHSGPGASQSYSHSQSHSMSMSMSMSMSRAMSPPSSAFPPGPSSPTGPGPQQQQQQQPFKLTRRPSLQPSLELERDLDTLTTLKARDDLADILGTHAVRVPVFVSCLVRVASCVLLVGFTLVLGGVWVCSPLAPVGRVGGMGMGTETLPPTKSAVPFWTTFAVVNVVHAVLAAAHMPPLLARIGLPVVAYAGLLVGLAAFFAGLAVWGAVA